MDALQDRQDAGTACTAWPASMRIGRWRAFAGIQAWRALAAPTIEREIVSSNLEARGQQMTQVARAGLHIEDPLTTLALEMMVVALRSSLEPRTLSGQADSCQFALLHQRIEIAIDRGQAQARRLGLRRLQNLLRK